MGCVVWSVVARAEDSRPCNDEGGVEGSRRGRLRTRHGKRKEGDSPSSFFSTRSTAPEHPPQVIVIWKSYLCSAIASVVDSRKLGAALKEMSSVGGRVGKGEEGYVGWTGKPRRKWAGGTGSLYKRLLGTFWARGLCVESSSEEAVCEVCASSWEVGFRDGEEDHAWVLTGRCLPLGALNNCTPR